MAATAFANVESVAARRGWATAGTALAKDVTVMAMRSSTCVRRGRACCAWTKAGLLHRLHWRKDNVWNVSTDGAMDGAFVWLARAAVVVKAVCRRAMVTRAALASSRRTTARRQRALGIGRQRLLEFLDLLVLLLDCVRHDCFDNQTSGEEIAQVHPQTCTNTLTLNAVLQLRHFLLILELHASHCLLEIGVLFLQALASLLTGSSLLSMRVDIGQDLLEEKASAATKFFVLPHQLSARFLVRESFADVLPLGEHCLEARRLGAFVVRRWRDHNDFHQVIFAKLLSADRTKVVRQEMVVGATYIQRRKSEFCVSEEHFRTFAKTRVQKRSKDDTSSTFFAFLVLKRSFKTINRSCRNFKQLNTAATFKLTLAKETVAASDVRDCFDRRTTSVAAEDRQLTASSTRRRATASTAHETSVGMHGCCQLIMKDLS